MKSTGKGKKTEIVVCGAAGRMGSTILNLAYKNSDYQVCGAVEAAGSLALGQDAGQVAGVGHRDLPVDNDLAKLLKKDRVIITFTTPQATEEQVKLAVKAKTPIVIGTTGLGEEQNFQVRAASRTIPVLYSSNMSVGVNLFWQLIRRAAELTKGFDVEIVEFHHNQKKDAPSGTAKTTRDILVKARHADPSKDVTYGRFGDNAKRKTGEIGIHALRGGGVVGDHSVIFASESERIEITHRAHSRENFAAGALLGARFLDGKKPGLYTMDDVLGL